MARLSSLAALLAALVIALIIVVFGLAIATFIKVKNHYDSSSSAASQASENYNEKGWKDAADLLKAAMDTSVDPCEDFFAYTCGNWNKKHPIPPGRGDYYIYSDMQNQVSEAIVSALDKLQPDSIRSDAIKKIKHFYDLCLKTEKVEYKLDDVQQLQIYKLTNGWPILGGWSPPANWDLGTLVAAVNRLYMAGNPYLGAFPSPLLASSVQVDARNVENYALVFQQGGLGMPREVYVEDTESYRNQSAEYKKGIVALAKKLKTVDEKSAESQAEAIYDLEQKLANISVPNSERRNHSAQYNPFTVAELDAAVSVTGWTWNGYFNTLLHNSDVQYVIVSDLPYFEQVAEVLNAADKQTLANLLIWRVLQTKLDFLAVNQAEISAFAPLPGKGLHEGSLSSKSRALTCASYLTNLVPWATGRIYVHHDFDDEARNKVNEITNYIIDAFADMIYSLDWMTDSTKTTAETKLRQMAQNYGWPTWLYEDVLLDAFHAGLNLDGAKSNFWEMYILVTTWFADVNFQKLGRSVNRHDFQMSPAVVNAWYEPTYNSITLPAGILQYPKFRKDFPSAFNFGATGNTPGHEITHGFDDEGIQYNFNGTLSTWMDEKTHENFNKMAQCVIDEYSQFYIPEIKMYVNGKTNQGENIADNGGMRASYDAFSRYARDYGQEPPLPGFEDFTMEQIYFISYGTSWCGTESPAHILNRVLTDPHSPPRYRVLGTLRNIPEFGKAFKCTQGKSPYYPNEPCHVWHGKL